MHFVLTVGTFSMKLAGQEGPQDHGNYERPKKSEFRSRICRNGPPTTLPSGRRHRGAFSLPDASVFGAPGHMWPRVAG